MITPPNILPIFDKAPHSYQVAQPWSCWGVNIPAGFICDVCSIPRAFWIFILPDGLDRPGGVWHDWGYQNQGRMWPDKFPAFRLTRAEVDATFHDILIASGVGRITAGLMWLGVRLGGWKAWRQSTGKPRIEPLRYKL